MGVYSFSWCSYYTNGALIIAVSLLEDCAPNSNGLIIIYSIRLDNDYKLKMLSRLEPAVLKDCFFMFPLQTEVQPLADRMETAFEKRFQQLNEELDVAERPEDVEKKVIGRRAKTFKRQQSLSAISFMHHKRRNGSQKSVASE